LHVAFFVLHSAFRGYEKYNIQHEKWNMNPET
jgi:hypothetical protein